VRSRSPGAGRGSHAAHARIEPLRDALDGAALAGRVAPLEQHHQLELLVHHPVLQLDQLALQPEQLVEVELAVQPLHVRVHAGVAEQLGQPVVVDFQFQLFVEAVDEVVVGARQRAFLGAVVFVHAGLLPAMGADELPIIALCYDSVVTVPYSMAGDHLSRLQSRCPRIHWTQVE